MPRIVDNHWFTWQPNLARCAAVTWHSQTGMRGRAVQLYSIPCPTCKRTTAKASQARCLQVDVAVRGVRYGRNGPSPRPSLHAWAEDRESNYTATVAATRPPAVSAVCVCVCVEDALNAHRCAA
eukprot:1156004-Pelagomonas_calceolata.AAC.2